MALRYTGRANPLVIDGRAYAPGDVVPLSQEEADRMAARSHLHSFAPAPGPKPPFPKQAAKANDAG
jgi:hypothetical protein